MQEKGKFLYLDSAGEFCHSEAPASAHDKTVTTINTYEELNLLISAIEDNGMDPVTQLFGFFTTEDPTYLPEGVNARNLAHRVGRDKLLEAVLTAYLQTRKSEVDQ